MKEVALPMELLRISIALAGMLVATYYDLFNKKNVPDIFLYAFLGIAFLTNIVAYDSTVSIYAISTAVVVFIAFFILYKIGQLGGADVYILSSLALLLPIQPTLLLRVPQSQFVSLPFMINIIITSGISFALWMFLKTIPIAFHSLKTPGKIGKAQLFGAFALVFTFGIFSFFASQNPIFPPSYFAFVSIMVLFSLYFTLFKDAINDSMVQWVHAKDIEQEDILAVDKMKKEFVLKYSLSRLVDASQLAKLKKIKEKIAVYKQLPPFVPHILIGLVISLLVGNIILFASGFVF